MLYAYLGMFIIASSAAQRGDLQGKRVLGENTHPICTQGILFWISSVRTYGLNACEGSADSAF